MARSDCVDISLEKERDLPGVSRTLAIYSIFCDHIVSKHRIRIVTTQRYDKASIDNGTRWQHPYSTYLPFTFRSLPSSGRIL